VTSDSSGATAVLPTAGTYSFVATIRNDAGSVATDTVTVAATAPASASPGSSETSNGSPGGSDSGASAAGGWGHGWHGLPGRRFRRRRCDLPSLGIAAVVRWRPGLWTKEQPKRIAWLWNRSG
jgi:hypothetical protein